MKIKFDENQRELMSELFTVLAFDYQIEQLENSLNDTPEHLMLELKELLDDIKVALERDAEKVKSKLEV